MSLASNLHHRNLGSRPKQVQFAIFGAGEGSCIVHNVDKSNWNTFVQYLTCIPIIVIAASGCYGHVGLEEPRHEQRTEARHEERHEQPVAEHREERNDEKHHD